MGYSTGEALIQTRIIAVNNFDSTNTSRSNWKLLNDGASDHYAILRPGEFFQDMLTMCTKVTHWTTVVELWQRVDDDYTGARTDLYARVADLMGIESYPKLGDTTGAIQENAMFEGAAEPQEVQVNSGSYWFKWDLRVKWNEETTISFSE